MKTKSKASITIILDLIVFAFSIFALIATLTDFRFMVDYPRTSSIAYLLTFTGLSNLFIGLVSLTCALYRIIFKKKSLPKWLFICKLVFATAITITFVTTTFYLAPLLGSAWWMLYINGSIFNHFLTPVLTIVTFIFFEYRKELKYKESLYVIIPIVLYAIIYITNVYTHLNPDGTVDKTYDIYSFCRFGIGLTFVFFIVFIAIAVLLTTLYIFINKKNGYVENNIKAVFVDIDWTLLDHSYKPSKFDLKSINKLKQLMDKGIYVFICTARPYHSIKQIKILDLFTPTGIISSNGGIVFINNKVIYKTEYPVKDFEKLCKEVIALGLNLEGIREKDCFVISENYQDMDSLFSTYKEDVPKLEDYHGQSVIGVNLFAKEEYDEKIKKIISKDAYFYRYHPNGVDLAYHIHNKGAGISKVLEHYHLDSSSALAIGDDDQDIEMFQVVDYKVAMGNAKKTVKKASNFITRHIKHHGVLHALNKHEL